MWRTVLAAVALVCSVGAGVAVSPDSDAVRETGLAAALGALPAATLTANFTDWSAVRSVVDAPGEVSSRASAGDQRAFLEAAAADDLTTASVLAGSALQMARPYGFNALDVQWEVLGQAREGAVVVVGLGNVPPQAVAGRLADLGYAPPRDGELDGGVWVGGVDLVTRLDPTLTSSLSNVALVADQGLLIMSDTTAYAEQVSAVVTSGRGSLLHEEPVAGAATPLLGSLVAVLHRAGHACSTTSYGKASPIDRRDARVVARRAGGLQPFESLGFGILDRPEGLQLEVTMAFSDPATAARQREVRTALTSGAAIGQGGTYEERFAVESSQVHDGVVALGLIPTAERMQLVSDLAAGPLMFSWCGG